jgi:sulfite reductase (NADPH) flavoprotein alpha-component
MSPSPTSALRLPRTAPFDAEQIAALNSVIGSANVVQRAWLAGFLAGLDASAAGADAAGSPLPAAANAEKPKLLILYATESGNAEALAAAAKADAAKRGFAARVLDMADAKPEALKSAANLLVIAATWGDGEPPQRAAPFYRALMGDAAPKLDGLRYSVLALGDSSYAQFCETGRKIDDRLAALGAVRAAPRVEADLDYEGPAKSWLGATLGLLAPKDADAGSVIHVDFNKAPATGTISKSSPFPAPITAHHPLTSSRADSATFHIELDLAGSGLAYEPGDAIGVLPKNDPALIEAITKAAGITDGPTAEALAARYDIATLTGKQIAQFAELTGEKALASEDARTAFLAGRQWIDLLEAFPHKLAPAQLTGLLRPQLPRYYSVASSQKLVGEEAHLTVARVAYESAGRARTGIASGFLADRRSPDDTVDVFVKPNAHFHLPADPASPIIMVGAGTGIAPYRAFLQEREATGAGGESWLIFGHRRFLHDFLYQLEIQAWLASGVLSRLDLATSRDAPEKRYVQHVLWDQRDALAGRLADGATLYLCGDAKHMARDVDATLTKILGEAALDELITAGRYKKDVY